MSQKNNVLIFSDVPTPSYERPYRWVLFVDYLIDKLDKIFVVSSFSSKKFRTENDNSNIVRYYYSKNYDFKKNQYNIINRMMSIWLLFIHLCIFFLRNKKIDFIRSGSTYLSFLLSIVDKRHIYIADICDFYFDLYSEFNMPFSKYLKKIIFYFEKIWIKRANLLFVDTLAQRRFMVNKMWIDWKKCVVIPNWVIIDYFPKTKEKDTEIMWQYGLEMNDKIIFYGWDISYMDWIENLIKYVAESHSHKIKLLIIGKWNESYINNLKNQIQNWKLERNIIVDFFKPYDQLYRYLSIADICVAPFKINFTSNTVECGKIITYLLSWRHILSTFADWVYSLYWDHIQYFKDWDYDDMKNKIDTLLQRELLDWFDNRRYLWEKFDFRKIILYEYDVINNYIHNPDQDFTKYDYIY